MVFTKRCIIFASESINNNNKNQFRMAENELTSANSERDITKVRQVPQWQADSKFEITGQEFLILQTYFNTFAQPIAVIQNLFDRALNDGTIVVKYFDDKNNEFTQEEVTSYINSQSADQHAQEPVQTSK